MNSDLTQQFNEAISKYMKDHQITQGAVCITRDEEILFHEGYGIDKNAQFRIASITKPITRAAIKLLISEGKLSLDTKAFPLINLQSIKGENINPELNKIIVEQLLSSSGGWDISVIGYDPTSEGSNPNECIRLMLHKPLQFEPGSKSVYSNLGYVVLGRVIEKVSGQSYEQFIQVRLMKPLGITSIKVGSSKKGGEEGNEAIYEDDQFDPYQMNIKTIDSAGGLISTAEDLCKFMQAYWLNGDKRDPGQKQRWTSIGGMQGTKTVAMQRIDGTNVAVLFNRRNRSNPADHAEVEKLVESLLD